MTDIVETVEDIEADKVATLDMGGTIVENRYFSSTQAAYNTLLGMDSETDQRIYREHSNGNGDLGNHTNHAIDQSIHLQAQDIDIHDYAEATQVILQDRDLLTGADMFVDNLHELGYTTVAVSSAPPASTMPYAEEAGIQILYEWKNFEFDDNGDFSHVQVNPEAKYGKHKIIEALQNTGMEVAHFGNGDNDKEAIEAADAGLKQWWTADPEKAFKNAKEEAQKL